MRVYSALEKLADLDAAVLKARDAEKDAARREKRSLHKRLVATRPGLITGEMRLREELADLYGDISRYGGRPTRTQIDRAAALERGVERSRPRVPGAVAHPSGWLSACRRASARRLALVSCPG